ncbi:hypothetical protein [Nonomuraea sp. JJY05]|uniref:hypothetical protein n=1 Tax=Nonomuraea sp. JJY05 TaxID=3350255 RepID=UPI00373F9D13
MKTTKTVAAAVAADVLPPAVPARAEATAGPSPISPLWPSTGRTSFTGRWVNGYPMDSTGRRVPFRFTLSVEAGRAPVSLRRRLYAPNRGYRWHRLDFKLEGGGQRMAPQTNLMCRRVRHDAAAHPERARGRLLQSLLHLRGSASGRLRFQVNDPKRDDNGGQETITVLVFRRP